MMISQECAAVARLEQRLRLLQPHRGRQTAVELDHREPLERRRGVDVGQLLELGHVRRRLELGARDHCRGAAEHALERRDELADRRLALARRAHLLRRRPVDLTHLLIGTSSRSRARASQVVGVAVARRAPVAARRQRAAGADLGALGMRRALELAGLEEAVRKTRSQCSICSRMYSLRRSGGIRSGQAPRVAVAPGLVGEPRDLARPVAEAQHVVQEEVLQLIGADGLLAVLVRAFAAESVGTARRDQLGRDRGVEHGGQHAPASAPNWSVSIAQRSRNWISVLGTEALTL